MVQNLSAKHIQVEWPRVFINQAKPRNPKHSEFKSQVLGPLSIFIWTIKIHYFPPNINSINSDF